MTVNLSNPAIGELGTTIYSVNYTQITGGAQIPPPAGAPLGTWKLNVTTADGSRAGTTFTVARLPVPVITSISPATVYVGTVVPFTVQGNYFQNGGRTIVNLTNTSGYNITTTLSGVYPTIITGSVTLPAGNFTGLWKVNVTTLDGGMGTKTGAVSIL